MIIAHVAGEGAEAWEVVRLLHDCTAVRVQSSVLSPPHPALRSALSAHPPLPGSSSKSLGDQNPGLKSQSWESKASHLPASPFIEVQNSEGTCLMSHPN